MDKSTVNDVRGIQNMLGGYTDMTLEQFRMLPYLIFQDIKNYKIEITEEKITITLIPYPFLKGWWLRRKHRKTDSQRAKMLAQYMLFWSPSQKKPKVIIQWQS